MTSSTVSSHKCHSAVTGVPAPDEAETDRGFLPTEVPLPDRFTAAGFVIHLPLPPSVNGYVHKLGNSSPGVKRWRLLADGYLYTQKSKMGRPVKGPFLLDVTWPTSEWLKDKGGKFDIDNRIKPLLDWLQARELVENDRLCKEMRVGFGDTDFGCRVEVRPRRGI